MIGAIWLITLMSLSRSTPDCVRPTSPFTSEAEAKGEAKREVECKYHFWREDREYDGIDAFNQVFGQNGYLYNDESLFDYDGYDVAGYDKIREQWLMYEK